MTKPSIVNSSALNGSSQELAQQTDPSNSNIAAPLPRSTVRLGRDSFLTVFTLTESQPWLKEKTVALCEMIDDCADHDEQFLLCRLLQRFTFLDGTSFPAAIQAMVDYIESDLGLDAANCSIAATENGRYADSSQFIVYSLKAANWKSLDWNTTSFIASLRGLAESAPKSSVVLVDEFIGTGETAEGRVAWIREQMSASGHNPKIYFAAVAGMEAGIARLKSHVDGIFVAHTLKRGISDFCSPEEAKIQIDVMKNLELSLATFGRRGKLKRHSLGYKGSESLYSRVSGNTPNNVFPIFWWELKRDGSQRQTVLRCL